MNVLIEQNQADLPLSNLSVVQLVKDFAASKKLKFDEVTIYFVDLGEISDLHARYFNDPTPTDCISFPMDDEEAVGYSILGEVFICPATALKYAKAHQCDVYAELTLYLIHGLLHLIGYDDIEEEDQKSMRLEEARYLARATKKGLLLHS